MESHAGGHGFRRRHKGEGANAHKGEGANARLAPAPDPDPKNPTPVGLRRIRTKSATSIAARIMIRIVFVAAFLRLCARLYAGPFWMAEDHNAETLVRLVSGGSGASTSTMIASTAKDGGNGTASLQSVDVWFTLECFPGDDLPPIGRKNKAPTLYYSHWLGYVLDEASFRREIFDDPRRLATVLRCAGRRLRGRAMPTRRIGSFPWFPGPEVGEDPSSLGFRIEGASFFCGYVLDASTLHPSVTGMTLDPADLCRAQHRENNNTNRRGPIFPPSGALFGQRCMTEQSEFEHLRETLDGCGVIRSEQVHASWDRKHVTGVFYTQEFQRPLARLIADTYGIEGGAVRLSIPASGGIYGAMPTKAAVDLHVLDEQWKSSSSFSATVIFEAHPDDYLHTAPCVNRSTTRRKSNDGQNNKGGGSVPIPATAAIAGDYPSATAVDLTIVLTGDMHGQVDTVPVLSSLVDASISRYALENERHERTLLLSAGDAFLGTSLFDKLGPAGLGLMYRPLAYNAMGLGNHDVELGERAMLEFASAARVPLVCFNIGSLRGVKEWVPLGSIRSNGTTTLAETSEKGASMNQTDASKNDTSPSIKMCATGFTVLDQPGHVNWTVVPDYAPPGSPSFWLRLNSTLDAMRRSGNCGLLFVLGHGGTDLDFEVASRTPSYVVVLGGHSHDILYETRYQDPGRVVMQAGAGLRSVGLLHLRVVPTSWGGRIVEATGRVETLRAPSRVAPRQPALFKLDLPQGVGMPLRSRDCRCGRCPLGDLIAELMFLADCNQDTDIAPVVGALREAGSIRSAIEHETSSSQLSEVLLWNNQLVVVRLSALDILGMMERSRESVLKDGGGAALSLFGVRRDAHGGVEVLTEDSARERCGGSNRRFGPSSSQGEQRYRRLVFSNDTALFVVTRWLADGGDDFVLPKESLVRQIGKEQETIAKILSPNATKNPLFA